MEATATGNNRTGAAQAVSGVKQMLDAVDEFSPPKPVSNLGIDVERQQYINAAEAIGSIPPTQAQAKSRKGPGRAEAPANAVLLDKLGERIAFERTGTRLYDALITKYLALSTAEPGDGADASGAAASIVALEGAREGETALETLQRIRFEELSHFKLLCECVQSLGGDPTAQTPCADVTAAASIGLMQVITDPRTTLAQSLSAILTAELTDNAAWELLSELARAAGQEDMAEQFVAPLEHEAEHLETVRGWLASLLMNNVGSPAV